jgi:hypothetical protein
VQWCQSEVQLKSEAYLEVQVSQHGGSFVGSDFVVVVGMVDFGKVREDPRH